MTSEEAKQKRIELERKGWKVVNGKFHPPRHLINNRAFSTDEALKIQEIFGGDVHKIGTKF